MVYTDYNDTGDIYIYSDQSCDGVDDFDPFDSC